jgi:Arc/MetJ family transcription regulator
VRGRVRGAATVRRPGAGRRQASSVSTQLIWTSILLCVALCDNSHMATNLAISQDLLERAVELSGSKTKTAAVTLALREFIARREQRRLLELFGSLEWDPAFDYKAERSR